ncbi:hypothetical protein GFGA_1d1209 [Gluconobacter frateurii NBRC 103465]|nr:hypothetical protein GFGA_1d1209 [Gluconobacter frateurii NBRC 103465]
MKKRILLLQVFLFALTAGTLISAPAAHAADDSCPVKPYIYICPETGEPVYPPGKPHPNPGFSQ